MLYYTKWFNHHLNIFLSNIQFNPSYYKTSSVSQIDLSKKNNRGGDEMIGNLSLGNKYINNLATPITALQAVNKTYCDSAIATAGGAFLPLSVERWQAL